MRKLLYFFSVVFACTLLSASPAGFNFSSGDIKSLGLQFDPVQIKIPGLKKTYRFLWISDLHVMAQDVSEIEKKWQPAMIFRRDKRFNNPVSKLPPAKVWEKLPQVLNRSGADAVFFGGDICDTGSAANLSLLAKGFKQLALPFVFLREDHDFSPWHLVKKDKSEQIRISRSIDGHPAVAVIEYSDLLIIGIDNSVYNITPGALKKFKALLAKGKPVILLIHVPIITPMSPELARTNVWGGQKKMQRTTREFVELATAAGSPVKAVFSGHLHSKYHVKLAPGLPLHVFQGAFEGFIGAITVSPGK